MGPSIVVSKQGGKMDSFLDQLHTFDCQLTRFISKRTLPTCFECVPYAGANLFGWHGMLLFWPSCFFATHGVPGVLQFLLSAGIGQSVCRFGKLVVSRDRPALPVPLPLRHFQVAVPLKEATGDGPSFPSGDSMAAGTVAGTLYFLSGNQAPLLLAVLGMYGRMFYHCHYFLDTFVGAAIGVSSAAVAVSCVPGGLSKRQFLMIVPLFVLWMKVSKRVAKWVRIVLLQMSQK